jgi:hypothetical protein
MVLRAGGFRACYSVKLPRYWSWRSDNLGLHIFDVMGVIMYTSSIPTSKDVWTGVISGERGPSSPTRLSGKLSGQLRTRRAKCGGHRRTDHVRWVPCHHGMARPQVADGGDALQLWSEAANILNKHSRTADKGWSSSWGLGVGLTTPHRKK